MLFNQRLKTFYMGKKARTVVLGERGKEPIYVIPRPKPVMEIHIWVIKDKIKRGLGVCLALVLGYLAASLDWRVLLSLCVLGFLWGLATGGDIESSP